MFIVCSIRGEEKRKGFLTEPLTLPCSWKKKLFY